MIQQIFGSTVVILKADNVEELFSRDLYESTVDYLMQIDNKFVDHPYVRGGKICTTDLNSKTEFNTTIVLDALREFLKRTALNYAHLYSDKPVKDLTFRHSWVNLTFQGCEIKNHNDRDDGINKSLIATFYPKVPADSANLVFIRNSKYGDWASDFLEKDLVRIKIEEGTIVIFDNVTLHAVDAHKAVDPRLCIATEFIIET